LSIPRQAAEQQAKSNAGELRDANKSLQKAEDDLEKSEKARRLLTAKFRQKEEANDALEDEKQQIQANSQRIEARMEAMSSEFDAVKHELESVKQQCEAKIAAATSRLMSENEDLKSSLNSASKSLAIVEDNLAKATNDLAEQLSMATMLRSELNGLKATSMAEKEELQLALRTMTSEAEESQSQLNQAEMQVTRMSQDEQVLQRSLESALQSATEMQSAPEDVSAEVRHGAWVGLYRNVGRILDSKFPLGAR
jgi:chromosome segregation ATPase